MTIRWGIFLFFAAVALADSAKISRDLGQSDATARFCLQRRALPSPDTRIEFGKQVGTVGQAASGSAWIHLGGLSAGWGSAILAPTIASAGWGATSAWSSPAARRTSRTRLLEN